MMNYNMRSIAIVSQKGGSGKSTLSVHLAVAALRTGQRVAVIDTDPQGSSAAWGDSREADEPAVVAIVAGELPSAIEEARSEGFDVIVIDTQPRASASLSNIVQAADFALIPIRPSAFDVATAEQTQRIVTAAGTPFTFVLNECPNRAPEIAESRAVLAQLGFVLDVTIGERRFYGRVLQTGLAVQEFEPTSDAAREIERAWSEIERRSSAHAIVAV
jgi:chromosome partitioning protein